MSLYFDEVGRLSYRHGCEVCDRFPSDDLDDHCLMCGYSQREISNIEDKVEAMNRSYDKYGHEFEGKKKLKKSRTAHLHLSKVSLGGGDFDRLVFADVDMNDDIRKMADLVQHMVELVIIPTEIVHKDMEDDDYDEKWEDEDEDDSDEDEYDDWGE